MSEPPAGRELLAGAAIRDAGEAAFVIEFGQTIEPVALARVSALDRHVRALQSAHRLPGLQECVPTFRSLAVLFDPTLTRPTELLEIIAMSGRSDSSTPIAQPIPDDTGPAAREWSLPVLYGGEQGPDLHELSQRAGLTIDDTIGLHTGTSLVVYMLGFLPGFGFLGDIDARLRHPRRTTPRTRVPAGSVAIANALGAVYPWESPGGWHLIGHCPVPLFDADRESPSLLQANDRVHFHRIDAGEHRRLVVSLASGPLERERFLAT